MRIRSLGPIRPDGEVKLSVALSGILQFSLTWRACVTTYRLFESGNSDADS